MPGRSGRQGSDERSGRLLGVHPVSGGLRLAGGGEDCAGIRFELFEPGGDISGVIRARMMGNAQISMDEARENLDTDFFCGIAG